MRAVRYATRGTSVALEERVRILPLLTLLSLALPATVRADEPVATILCYHEIDAAPNHETIPRRSAAAPSSNEQLRYTATPDQFVAQLDYLQQNGYHVIALADLVDFLLGVRETLPARSVVITMDDGWACTYSQAMPELRRRNLPFTVFVYPEIVGHGAHAMTWAQIRAMSEAGATIGSHTMSHPFLTLKNNPRAAGDYETFLCHELLDSRTTLEKKIGSPVRFLSYPYGDYDEGVLEHVSEYGYIAAVTTERGPISRSTPPDRLKRYLVHNDTDLAEFKTFLLN
jgi:peptidoglycan/xylan/chitin deacetylase (PgdA/CDA1 family)